MLKIKDNVDLKELQNYCFRYNNSSHWWERKIGNRWYDLICIDEDREIFEMTEQIDYWDPTFSDEEWFDKEYIKDLIRADLVEKVENDK